MLGFIRSEVRALSALGRIDEVQAVAERSLSIPATSGTGGQVLEEAARTLRAHGHREASLVLAARAVEWHRTQSTRAPNDETRADLGRVLDLAERWDEADRMFATVAAKGPERLGYQAPAPRVEAMSAGLVPSQPSCNACRIRICSATIPTGARRSRRCWVNTRARWIFSARRLRRDKCSDFGCTMTRISSPCATTRRSSSWSR